MLYGIPAIPFPAGETVKGAVHGIEAIEGPFTRIFNVQFCPPNEIEKLAVPLVVGVPVIVYVKLPVLFVNDPACNVAVNPVTPVDAIGNPEGYDPPFPFVYGIVAFPV